jgi:hypothetical protein
MGRRRKQRQHDDHTEMAFVIAGIFACLIVAVVEDALYSAADDSLWSFWRYHPVSILAGTLGFLGLLYCLQRINDKKHALRYLEPYTPFLGLAGANLALKLNAVWLLPVGLFCVIWSVGQVRKLRGQKPFAGRESVFK